MGVLQEIEADAIAEERNNIALSLLKLGHNVAKVCNLILQQVQ